MRRLPALAVAAAVVAGACSDPAAHVTLVPHGGPCGRPGGISFVQITAYTPRGEILQLVQPDQSLAIDVFPADTMQIGVEVFVGGSVAAAGKSAPLDFGGLADRAEIPVLMAPLDGFCAVGDMLEARAQPLVARAGSGALIVGGIGAAGPLLTAEYYDADAGVFSAVTVPEALTGDGGGFAGTALAPLPDGRVALIGGPRPAFVVFDPRLRAFSTDPVLIRPRAFHAAIATGDDEVMIAGGCFGASAGRCSDGAVPEILRYRLTQLREPEVVSSLTVPDDSRIGAGLFDLGVQMDGRRGYLLAGGSGDPGLADRFAAGDPSAVPVPGGHVQAVALDGGAVLTAFAGDDASPVDGAAAVYAPVWPGQPTEALAARPIARAPDRQGVRLIALEDGRVAGFGGDPVGRVLLYDPTRDTWTAPPVVSSDQPGPLTAPSLARLDDGSVLVLGGAVSPKAWVYRPSLVGPASGSITAVPATAGGGVLTAPDPATVTRMADGSPVWRLTAAADAPLARALVGGSRLATGSVSVVVHVLAGGVALIAQQTGPGQAIVAELAPGEPARIVRLEAGEPRVLCRGSSVLAAFDPLAGAVLRLEIDDGAVRLSIGSGASPAVACGVGSVERGAWGVAALGAGAQITVDSVAVDSATVAR